MRLSPITDVHWTGNLFLFPVFWYHPRVVHMDPTAHPWKRIGFTHRESEPAGHWKTLEREVRARYLTTRFRAWTAYLRDLTGKNKILSQFEFITIMSEYLLPLYYCNSYFWVFFITILIVFNFFLLNLFLLQYYYRQLLPFN